MVLAALSGVGVAVAHPLAMMFVLRFSSGAAATGALLAAFVLCELQLKHQ